MTRLEPRTATGPSPTRHRPNWGGKGVSNDRTRQVGPTNGYLTSSQIVYLVSIPYSGPLVFKYVSCKIVGRSQSLLWIFTHPNTCNTYNSLSCFPHNVYNIPTDGTRNNRLGVKKTRRKTSGWTTIGIRLHTHLRFLNNSLSVHYGKTGNSDPPLQTTLEDPLIYSPLRTVRSEKTT